MDKSFFIGNTNNINNTIKNESEGVQGFAEAVAGRFGTTPMLTARLTTVSIPLNAPLERMSIKSPPIPSTSNAIPMTTAASTISSSPTTTISPSHFIPISPTSLQSFLSNTSPQTLILDIRSPSAYATTRIPHALPLSVPSTLLKRPAFSLQKLGAMLSSPTARLKFSKWKDAHRVLVYDADTSVLGDKESPALLGLCRKFIAEGFTGEVYWLKGGVQAVWKEAKDVLVSEQLDDDENTTLDKAEDGMHTQSLPRSAFQTTFGAGVASAPSKMHLSLRQQPLPSPMRISPTKQFPRPALQAAASIALQHQPHLSFASTSSSSPTQTTPSTTVPRSATSMSISGMSMNTASTSGSIPFYDNIRQNYELSAGSMQMIPLVLPEDVMKRAKEVFGKLSVESEGSFNSLSPNGSASLSASISVSPSESGGSSPIGSTSASRGGSQASSPGLSCSPDSPVSEHIPEDIKVRENENDHEHDGDNDEDEDDKPKVSKSKTTSKSRKITQTQNTSPLAWIRRIIMNANTDRGAEELASQFLEIEREEQRRLVGVMKWHSKEGQNQNQSADNTSGEESSDNEVVGKGADQDVVMTDVETEDEALEDETSFPYSITAGVEKGSKNRYRNIWPFEHARVRLQKPFLPHAHPLSLNKGNSATNSNSNSSSNTNSNSNSSGKTVSVTATAAEIAANISSTNHSATTIGRGGGGGILSLPPIVPAYITPLSTHYPFTARFPSSSALSISHPHPHPLSHTTLPTSTPLISPALSTPSLTPGSSVGTGYSSERDKDSDDDYVNASYVQPLGTIKKYIATQGPLESTYADFWTLVWQQNVRVIIMLTREIEGAQMKCGRYWTPGNYGPLKLELLETEGADENESDQLAGAKSGRGGVLGFDFYVPTPVGVAKEKLSMAPDGKKGDEESLIIKRKMKLTHTRFVKPFVEVKKEKQQSATLLAGGGGEGHEGGASYPYGNDFVQHRGQVQQDTTTSESESEPHARSYSSNRPQAQPHQKRFGGGKKEREKKKKERSRVITQLQYLGWPDMNVPDSPAGLLNLIKEADKAAEQAERECEEEEEEESSSASQMSDGDDREMEGKEKSRREKRKMGPILLHCSAGVGRTGGFIIVDAVLDGVRREVRNKERWRVEREKRKEEMKSRQDEFTRGTSLESSNNASVDASASGSRSGSAEVEGEKMDIDEARTHADNDRLMYARLRIGQGAASGNVMENARGHGPREGRHESSRHIPVGSISSSWGSSDPGLSNASSITKTSTMNNSGLSDLRNFQDRRGQSGMGGRGHVVHVPVMKSDRISTASSVMNDLTDVERGILDRRMDWDAEGKEGRRKGATVSIGFGDKRNMLSAPKNSSNGSSTTPAKTSDVTAQPGADAHQHSSANIDQPLSHSSGRVKFNEKLLSGLTHYFTADDANQMFTNIGNERPEFAMDIEPAEQNFGRSYIRQDGISWSRGSDYGSGSGEVDRGRNIDPSFQFRDGGSSGDVSSGGRTRFSSDEVPWRMSGEESDSSLLFGGGISATSNTGDVSSSSSVPVRGMTGLSMSSPTSTEKVRRESMWRRMHGPLPTSILAKREEEAIKDQSQSNVPSFNGDEHMQTTQPLAENDAALRSSSLYTSSGYSTDNVTYSSTLFSSRPSHNSGDHGSSSCLKSNYTAPTTVASSSVAEFRSRSGSPPKEKKPKQKAKTRDRNHDAKPDAEYDYSAPRALHRDDSPLDLSTLKDPIQEVLEDMREQRMSLCQSLRQYVFVHRVIIEGALQIVEEERNITSDDKLAVKDAAVKIVQPAPEYRSEHPEIFEMDSVFGVPAMQAVGKRGASPTELPKTDKKGDEKLSKRPSIKRGKSGGSEFMTPLYN